MQSYVALLTLLVAAAAANHHESHLLKKNIPIVRFESSDDHLGNYKIDTESGDGTMLSETGSLKHIGNDAAVVKTGTSSWVTPEGQHLSITYIADENGFRATGGHLPVAPPMPAEIAKMLPTLPILSEAELYGSSAPVVFASSPLLSAFRPSTFAVVSKPAVTSFEAPLLVAPVAPKETDIKTSEYEIHSSPTKTFVRIGH